MLSVCIASLVVQVWHEFGPFSSYSISYIYCGKDFHISFESTGVLAWVYIGHKILLRFNKDYSNYLLFRCSVTFVCVLYVATSATCQGM